MRSAFILLCVLGLAGCDKEEESGGSDNNTSSETDSVNCVTDWSCYNYSCECADGSGCGGPEDCEEVCEVCE